MEKVLPEYYGWINITHLTQFRSEAVHQEGYDVRPCESIEVRKAT